MQTISPFFYYFINNNCFSFYRDFKDFKLYISQIPKYKNIVQIRNFDWSRVLSVCKLEDLHDKILSLDTLFTFYD